MAVLMAHMERIALRVLQLLQGTFDHLLSLRHGIGFEQDL